MEETLQETPVIRRFTRLADPDSILDESTILNCRRLPRQSRRARGTILDATVIAAPNSTKNKDSERS